MPYLSTLEVCSRRGAIQIHVYFTLPYLVPLTSRLNVFQDETKLHILRDTSPPSLTSYAAMQTIL